MTDVDIEGLRQRQPRFKRKKEKGTFTAVGPNWVVSLDGHDKLMSFQKSTFPLAIYGCLDTNSRKILFLKVWIPTVIQFLLGGGILSIFTKARYFQII